MSAWSRSLKAPAYVGSEPPSEGGYECAPSWVETDWGLGVLPPSLALALVVMLVEDICGKDEILGVDGRRLSAGKDERLTVGIVCGKGEDRAEKAGNQEGSSAYLLLILTPQTESGLLSEGDDNKGWQTGLCLHSNSTASQVHVMSLQRQEYEWENKRQSILSRHGNEAQVE